MADYAGLCFTAEEAGATISLTTSATIQKSADGITWESYTSGAIITLENIGDKVYLKNDSSTFSSGLFSITGGKVAASGSIMSLVGDENSLELTVDDVFCRTFKDCTSLTSAPSLPATTLSSRCYMQMFEGCTSLASAPVLPATTLSLGCYANMFYNCSAITTPPALPATNINHLCYAGMFAGCSALLSSPKLPATVLKKGCYDHMFFNCTSLTDAGEILATTLAKACCAFMFDGCTSLVNAPALLSTKLDGACYLKMFYNCTSLVKAPEMFNDISLNDSQFVYSNCYRMFYGCSNLNYIKVHSTSWNTSYYTEWLSGVSSSGTFVKPADTSIQRSTSGIPSGWTIEDL